MSPSPAARPSAGCWSLSQLRWRWVQPARSGRPGAHRGSIPRLRCGASRPAVTVHVSGAGLVGLAAATRLAATGCAVTLHEQVRHAGGRCRSFADRKLGRRLDCGIHLTFAGRYQHLNRYLAEIGAPDALVGPTRAACRFVDTRRGEEWWLSPNAGRLPWWI